MTDEITDEARIARAKIAEIQGRILDLLVEIYRLADAAGPCVLADVLFAGSVSRHVLGRLDDWGLDEDEVVNAEQDGVAEALGDLGEIDGTVNALWQSLCEEVERLRRRT